MLKKFHTGPKWTVTVKKEIDACHWLEGTKAEVGKCQRIHGHRWAVQVSITATKLNKFGMVINFTTIKEWLSQIIEDIDHRILNFYVSPSTAENFARFVFHKINKKLYNSRATYRTDLQVESVTVFETPNSPAVYNLENMKEEFSKNIRETRKRDWSNPEKKSKIIENMKKSLSDPVYRAKVSKRMLENNPMKDRKNVESMMKALKKTIKLRPNKEEKKLIEIFAKYKFPFKYTGDCSLLIEGKNPDFIYVEKKKIVEYNNRFWHSDNNKWYNTKDDSKERIQFFNERGYQCLVIWNEDMKDEKGLVKKIEKYLNE